MCGICGFSWEDKKLIRDMTRVISHRGPDGYGYYVDKNVSLGHSRLKIIDLSEKGKQPMHNEDGDYWIIYNGEIYNFKEIRDYLEKKGHVFYSNTDTEVIIHSYEEMGEDCLRYLNGMFAFAIWDGKKLFLARDRIGIKPLYYTITKKGLTFASEIKAILKYEGVKREVDFEALHDFLSFRCNSLEKTMFKGIYKLLPAHFLVYEDKKVRIKRYWNLTMAPKHLSENAFSKLLLEKLKKAVQMRLVSDVPLGVYLSGGIDSGSIVALMSQSVEEPVKTFSVGFGFEQEYDELKKARFTAEYFKTDHKEIIVKPNTIKLLPKIVWHLDEPMSDPTSIPMFLLSKSIKKYATVILTGDGGDEQFFGYEQIKMMNLHKKYAQLLPIFLRKSLPLIIKHTPKNILNLFFKYSSVLGEEGIKRFSDFISTNNKAKMYLSLVSIFNENEKKELYSAKTGKLLEHIDYIESIDEKYFRDKMSFVDQVAQLDTDKILVEDMLMKADRNTMAHSVEERVPFLDHTFTEFTATIPWNLKLRGLSEKYILRKSLVTVLPKEILKRKKERFFVPIHNWLEGELFEITKQILSKENISKQGYFKYQYIEKKINNFKKSKLFYSRQLWSLLCFQIWHRIYIEESEKTDLALNKLF